MNIKILLFMTSFLFFTGVSGIVLNRNNLLIVLMSLEIMLLAVNLNFIVFSLYFDDIVGQICVLFILCIAATESAVGLAIISIYNNLKNSIQV